MQSEGTYKELSETCIEGPGFETLPQKVFKDLDLAELLNLSYAEGRKSREKDFKEAIGWADSICFDRNYSKDYKKWKQARGLE